MGLVPDARSVSHGRSRIERRPDEANPLTEVIYMKSAIPDCLFLSFSKIDSNDRSNTSNRCFV